MTTSERVAQRIADLADWRAETLSRVRELVYDVDPDVTEDLKWPKATNPGVPTWERDGIICTGEPYKATVKLTFPKGASLPDPAGLFNSSLEGKTRRAIDVREGETLDADAFQDLVRAAIACNQGR